VNREKNLSAQGIYNRDANHCLGDDLLEGPIHGFFSAANS
jgi:hypothetical protein